MPEKDCQGLAVTFMPNDPLFWLHHAQLDRLWNEVRAPAPTSMAAAQRH
jgi:tyrosinase